MENHGELVFLRMCSCDHQLSRDVIFLTNLGDRYLVTFFLSTMTWPAIQKSTTYSQIVGVNNRVNRQIFANLSSSKGGH